MSEQTFRYLNKAVPRTEDYRLLTGYGRYLDDIEIAGALHVSFVRSPHAHARIVSVDTAAAAGMPGVVTVVTGRELAQWTTPMRVAAPIEGLLPVEFATMPTDIVRFQGILWRVWSPRTGTSRKTRRSRSWSSSSRCLW